MISRGLSTEDHVTSCDPVRVVSTGRCAVWLADQGIVCYEVSGVCGRGKKRSTLSKIFHVCSLKLLEFD